MPKDCTIDRETDRITREMVVSNTLEETIVGIFEDCWTRIARNESYINLSEILDVLKYIEMRLSTIFKPLKEIDLLTDEQRQTILLMSENDPRLKLYHEEFEGFLLKLVGASTLGRFVAERLQISEYELLRTLRASSVSKPRLSSEFSNAIKSETEEIEQPVKRESVSSETRPYSSLFANSGAETPTQRSELKSGILKKSQDHDLKDKVSYLEQEVSRLQREIEVYERVSRDSSNSNVAATAQIRELLAELKEKDIQIQNLDLFSGGRYNDIFNRLSNSIKRQDILIQTLKEKLLLTEDTMTNFDNRTPKLNSFIQTLPFVKQYYVYYKQQRQLDWKSIIINITELLLATVIFISTLKFVLYCVVCLLTNNRGNSDFDTYISQEGSFINDSGSVSFQWWKEIPWLEYYIYNFVDYLS